MIKEETFNLTAGLSSISNLTNERDNYHLEVDHLNDTYEIQTSILPEISAYLLPSKFNNQSHNHDSNTPIRIFGSCVSCSFFAGTDVLRLYGECQYQNLNNYPGFLEKYLIRYDIHDFETLRRVGTINNPFTASDSSFKRLISYTIFKSTSGSTWHCVKKSFSVPLVDHIKTSVHTCCSIFIAFGVNSLISVYSGGIFHVVELGGGTTSNENTNWICKNSWKTGWGKVVGSDYIGYGAAYMTNPPTISPTITCIMPSSAKRGSLAQINTLSGSNFLSGATMNLTRIGYSKVTASNVNAASSSLITGKFNLTGVSSGIWNVSVKNSNGMIRNLTNDFTVFPNIPVKFFGVPGTTIRPWIVNFYDGSDMSPASCAWNFGNRILNATTKNATHNYSTVGNYTVTNNRGLLI